MRLNVAVVILNFNGKNYLEKFLAQVIHYSNGADVIVADNASTDDSVSYLKEKYPEVKLIELEKNTGYAGGYNNALKKLNHKYFVLLNSDVEVTDNWINPLYELMESDENIAACQPKILSYHEQKKFEHAGAAGGYLDKNFYPFCRGRIFEFTEDDMQQYNDTQQIFWASGACMMVRRIHFEAAGGFDTDFFAHMEEIDLSWRWGHMELKSFVVPESVVFHVGGGTLAYKNPNKTYLNFRNSLFMIYKNYPGHPMKGVYVRLLYDAPAAGLFLLKGQWKHFKAVWKAHRSFFKNKKALKIKRLDIKHRKNTFGILPVNIVTSHFIKRKKTFNTIVRKAKK